MNTEKSIKVLGFDSWTVGCRHYCRLVESFRCKNIELLLVHLGSWGNEPGRPKEEILDGLLVRDISYYEKPDFFYLLRNERPDVVLFLSTASFAHQACQRYCHALGIPTINLAHGIITVAKYEGQDATVKHNIISHTKWLFSRFKLTFHYTLPAYILSLLRTKAGTRDWLGLGSDLIARLKGVQLHKYASDARPTKACVYVESEVDDAVTRYSLSRDDVVVVGNPDFIQFGLQTEMVGSHLGCLFSDFKEIMYIECGMTAFGVFFKSRDEYIEYIGHIGNVLKQQGFQLLFKLKPQGRNYETDMTRKLARHDIKVIDNNTFFESLHRCSAAITEPSTLGIIPAILGMPLFLNMISPLDEENIGFGSIFTTYPRHAKLNDPDVFAEVLSYLYHSVDTQSIQDWIRHNAGPMPASMMPARVADVVLSLAGRKTS